MDCRYSEIAGIFLSPYVLSMSRVQEDELAFKSKNAVLYSVSTSERNETSLHLS